MFKTSTLMMPAIVAPTSRALIVRDRMGGAGFVGAPTGLPAPDPGLPVS